MSGPLELDFHDHYLDDGDLSSLEELRGLLLALPLLVSYSEQFVFKDYCFSGCVHSCSPDLTQPVQLTSWRPQWLTVQVPVLVTGSYLPLIGIYVGPESDR